MTEPLPPHRRSVVTALRGSFLTGLGVVLPLGLTIYVVWALIGDIDGRIVRLIPDAYEADAGSNHKSCRETVGPGGGVFGVAGGVG